MDPVTALTVASVGTSFISSLFGSKQAEEEAKEAARVARFNAQLMREEAKRLRGEYAMNAWMTRASGRRQIASSENEMAAMGNIGPSADAAILDAYLNLDSDLSAMKYNYDSRVNNYFMQAEEYERQARAAEKSGKSAKTSGILSMTAGLLTGGMAIYKAMGGNALTAFQKYGGGDPSRPTVSSSGSTIGYYGGYGVYNG